MNATVTEPTKLSSTSAILEEVRQITLTEWESEELLLSSSELNDLVCCSDNVLQLQPITQGRTRVTAKSLVGQVRLNSVELRILPKYPMPSLLAMLAEVYELARLKHEFVGYKTSPEIVDILVHIFLKHVDRIIRQGLKRTYVQEEEALVAVRGRIDLRRTSEFHLRGQPRVQCRFEEFTLDGPENRTLLAALGLIVGNAALAPRRRNSAHRLTGEFWGVQQVMPKRLRKKAHEYDRLNAHYHPALELAHLILNCSSILQDFGVNEANGFLIDMNKLFEEFVYRKLKKSLAKHGARVSSQRRFAFDAARQSHIQPDLLVERADGRRLVADTKYKIGVETDPGDLYQMLAYCQVLNIRRGILIRIGDSQSREYLVRNSDTRIEVVNVDLGGTVQDIDQSLTSLSEHILRQ